MPIEHDIINNIQSAINELGAAGSTNVIQDAVNKLKNQNQREIIADVYVSKQVASDTTHPFHKLLNVRAGKTVSSGEYSFHVYLPGQMPVKTLGGAHAAMAVVVMDDNLLQDTELVKRLKHNSGLYSVFIVVNYSAAQGAADAVKLNFYGKYIQIDGSAVEDDLAAVINGQLSSEQKDKLRSRSLCNGLMPVLQLTKEIVDSENRLIALRKNLNAQQTTLIRKDEAKANVNDVASFVKTQIQNWNTDMEKAIKLKYEELNKPSTGRFAQQLTGWSEEITDLEREEVAEKSEKLSTTLSNEYNERFLGNVRKSLSGDFANDYNIIVNSAESMIGKIAQQLKQKGVAMDKNALQIDFRKFPDQEKSLQNYVLFNRNYNGELVKKGVTEYFIALREYTGIIMVAVGLLAPLNMISSAASSEGSNDKEGFFASIAPIFKHMTVGIRLTTAFLTIGMIFYGYYDLRKRIPKRRVEEFTRELKKAKELVQAEGKRMFSDASKDWQNAINMWLKEVYYQLSTQVEKTFRDHSSTIIQKGNDDKVRAQRVAQSIDNNVKKVASAEKLIENSIRQHRDFKLDLEKAFRN